jgi:hypothetical protein
MLLSMSKQLPCMQVTRSGRKLPAEARQRQAMSVTWQFEYWDWLMQFRMHCGRVLMNWHCASGSQRTATAKTAEL